MGAARRRDRVLDESGSGVGLTCSFWISSTIPMVRAEALAMARLSGNEALLKVVMRWT